MSTPVHITEQSFEREVLNTALPVLVDFWAAWCGPCRMIAPIVEDLAREYEGRLKVGKVDVDENPDLASRYGVQSIPTLLVFVGGQPFTRIVGYAPKAELKRAIDTALSAAGSPTPVGVD
ncbi:MAG: thioredoxin [Armatimonadetes bacterium]|nr:thioredoxin [Armatimonadota bacterium]